MNSVIAPAMMTATTRSNGSSALRIWSQRSPKSTPSWTSAIDQMKAPAVEYTMNFSSGMRATPAGKLMKVRTIGISRLKKAVAAP